LLRNPRYFDDFGKDGKGLFASLEPFLSATCASFSLAMQGKLLWIHDNSGSSSPALATALVKELRDRGQLLSVYSCSTWDKSTVTDITVSLAAQCAEELFESKELFVAAFEKIDWLNESTYSFDKLIIEPLHQFTSIISPLEPRVMIVLIDGLGTSEEGYDELIAFLNVKAERLPGWIRLVVAIPRDKETEQGCAIFGDDNDCAVAGCTTQTMRTDRTYDSDANSLSLLGPQVSLFNYFAHIVIVIIIRWRVQKVRMNVGISRWR
jgi:hypothetical protein